MKTKTGLTKFGGSIFGPSERRRRRRSVKKSTKKSTKKRSTRKSTKKLAKKKSSFAALVKGAESGILKSKAKTAGNAIMAAIRSAKKFRKGKRITVPRIIKVPSISGGILPILPILAGLGAVGSLAGTAAGVVKTIREIKNARDQLEEKKRINVTTEPWR